MLYSQEEFIAIRNELEGLVDFPIKELIKESGLTRPTVQSWYYQEGTILVSTKTALWIAITNLVERRKKEFEELRSGLQNKKRQTYRANSKKAKKGSSKNNDFTNE